MREATEQCQDAQHQFAGTGPQPRQRNVRHAVLAMDTAVAMAAVTARPTLLAAGAATAVVAGRVEAPAQGRAGRAPVRPFRTRLLR